MDRRDFLAATPIVFGLSLLSAGPQDKQGPASRPKEKKEEDPLAQALLALQKGDAPGIAIVVPRDAAARQQLADMLNDMLESMAVRSAKPAALWMRAVFVCVPAEKLVVKERENVVLLDPQGQRVRGATIDWTTFECAEELHALIDTYERGWRERRKRTAPEPGERELATLLAAPNPWDAELEPTRRVLRESCRFGSHLIWTWRTSTDEGVRATIDTVLISGALTRASKLPFGVSEHAIGQKGGGVDACPACGMAIITRRSRFVLRFAGE